MQRINVFMKQNWYYNLVDNQGANVSVFNPPHYNLEIDLYKGIDNKIEFCVRDNDRKGVQCRDKELTLTILNERLHKKLEKKLHLVNAYKGIFDTTITEKEMRDFVPATYQASVVYKDLEGDETMLYSSVNYDPVFHIKVHEGFRDTFKPSVVLNPSDFLHNFFVSKEDGMRYDYWESSVVKADETDCHTASITVQDNFLGTVIMEGSMEADPTQDEGTWIEMGRHEWTDETKSEGETVQLSVQMDCLWIRFRILIKASNQASGKVSEIVYRN